MKRLGIIVFLLLTSTHMSFAAEYICPDGGTLAGEDCLKLPACPPGTETIEAGGCLAPVFCADSDHHYDSTENTCLHHYESGLDGTIKLTSEASCLTGFDLLPEHGGCYASGCGHAWQWNQDADRCQSPAEQPILGLLNLTSDFICGEDYNRNGVLDIDEYGSCRVGDTGWKPVGYSDMEYALCPSPPASAVRECNITTSDPICDNPASYFDAVNRGCRYDIPISCQFPGVWDGTRDRCEALYSCTAGTFTGSDGECAVSPDCAQGSFNTVTRRCEWTVEEYEYDPTLVESVQEFFPVGSPSCCTNDGNYISWCTNAVHQWNPGRICTYVRHDVNNPAGCQPASNGNYYPYRVDFDCGYFEYVNRCPSGYDLVTYQGQYACRRLVSNVRYESAQCPSGYIDRISSTNTCRVSVCPSGYEWDSANQRCYQAGSCPSDHELKTDRDVCTILREADVHCAANGQVLDSAELKCLLPTCPLLGGSRCTRLDGEWKCSALHCADYNQMIEDEPWDSNSYQNDGSRDDEGNCLGQVYLFNGMPGSCRLSGWETFFKSCCDQACVPDQNNPKGGCKFIGLIPVSCKQEEGKVVYAKQAGMAKEIGTRCVKKIKFIGCIQRAKTYCVFQSKLALLMHEQGRPQLKAFGANGGWGSPESPNCRGFTPEEFSMLDFSEIDFTSYFGDIRAKAVDSVGDTMQNKLEDFYQKYR